MTHRFAGVAAVAAVLAAAPAAAQEAVLLRFTPPVGQVTHYKAVTQTWMQIPGMSSGDTTQPTMTQTLYSTRTVTAMDGQARVVTTVIDSSTRDMGPMSGMMPAGDMFRGITTTEHVDPLGRVLSFELTPPPGMNPMMAEAMRRRSARRQIAFPERRVAPGDTWSTSDTMAMGGGPGGTGGGHAVLDLTYKLDRVEQQGGAQLATLSLNGTVHGDSADASGGTSGTMTGEMVVDLGAARVMRASTRMTMQIRSPDGEVVPMRNESTTELIP
jgi:hypothetical protein